ncbi:hypothetical protein D9M70_608320 [compost metagenome]
MAWLLFLYGTLTALTPARCLNNSPLIRPPTLALAKESGLLSFLAHARNSLNVAA